MALSNVYFLFSNTNAFILLYNSILFTFKLHFINTSIANEI